MEGWVSCITNAALRSKAAAIGALRSGFSSRLMKRVAIAALTCMLAVGGAVVGVFVGAIKGQTTETGFLRGAGIGAVTGALAAIQLLETAADRESLSKGALLSSLMNGRVFMEWVSPAVLKAYQWQVRHLEATYREVSDLYDVSEAKGLSNNCIQKLPMHKFHSSQRVESNDDSCCSICVQDFKDEDSVRELPTCGHLFHLDCIDQWLTRQGTCPLCRVHVCDQ